MYLLLLFFIARIVLKRNPFSRVVQEIRGKILQSCSKVYKLVSQSILICHDEITYFKIGVFQYGYHDMVESRRCGAIFFF